MLRSIKKACVKHNLCWQVPRLQLDEQSILLLSCGNSEIKVSNYSMLYEVLVVTIMKDVVFWFVIGRFESTSNFCFHVKLEAAGSYKRAQFFGTAKTY